MVSALIACDYKKLLHVIKPKGIDHILFLCVGTSNLVSDDWQFDRIIDFFHGKLSHHVVRECYYGFNNLIPSDATKDLKNYKGKQLAGFLESNLGKLSKQGKKELKWFVTELIIPNENLVKVWDSVFIEDSKEIDLVLNVVDDFVTDNIDELEDLSVEETTKPIEDVNDAQNLETLLDEESKPVVMETIQVFEPFEFSDDFEEIIKNLDGNERGFKTAEYIRNFLDSKIEGLSIKEQSDHLCRAFESCTVKDWPDWLKFAVMNVIRDKGKIFDESSKTEYNILSPRQQNDYIQFKANPQKRTNIIADQQYYSSWQRIIQVS